MKVRHIMHCPVRTVAPNESLADAAALMADRDVGVLPVIDDERLVGIVTDRDLAVRGLAAGMNGGAPVSTVMTEPVATCRPDDELADVLSRMCAQQVRRMPVCSAQGELLGLISVGDAAREAEYGAEATGALAGICRPHGPHCQIRDAA